MRERRWEKQTAGSLESAVSIIIMNEDYTS